MADTDTVEGELVEGALETPPKISWGCKSRRMNRKRRASISPLPQAAAIPSDDEEQGGGSSPLKESPTQRPQRRSACGVAKLMNRIHESEFIAAALAAAPASRQSNANSKRRQNSTQVAGLARKPQLGRVKKCSTKAVELLEVGELNAEPGWYNVGYIFPKGFVSRTQFRSSVDLGVNCWHTCSIIGEEGTHWPNPTFQIVAEDNTEPLVAKSATGAWALVLSRIKFCILARQKQGENLPPPSGTAIPGPEFFGLTNTAIVSKIEQLDPFHKCGVYWQGKQDRLAYLLIYGNEPDRKFPPRNKRQGNGQTAADIHSESFLRSFMSSDSEEDDRLPNRWESLNRAERLLKRKGLKPMEGGEVDENALLPGVIDPITLAPIENPAMSPAGHVMGYLTWKAVLAEFGRCPFTKQSLHKEQLTVLTANNIARLRNRLILP